MSELVAPIDGLGDLDVSEYVGQSYNIYDQFSHVPYSPNKGAPVPGHLGQDIWGNFRETAYIMSKGTGRWRYVWITAPVNPTGKPFLLYTSPAGEYGILAESATDDSPLKKCLLYLATLGYTIVIVQVTDDWENIWFSYSDSPRINFTCDQNGGQANDQCWAGARGVKYEQSFWKDFDSNLKLWSDNGRLFNIDSCAIIGYSAGTAMASRLLQEAGAGKLYLPKISCAVLIAGGSLDCYAYNGTIPPAPFAVDGREQCPPCSKALSRGCCPPGITEPYYDDGNLHMHPPTLLLQTQDDSWADPRASIFYFRALALGGARSVVATGEGDMHGMVDSQMNVFVRFVEMFI